ncbi:SDR family NAD(P)-dependent oxidoreductase [Auraticoccus monumenti]|uniref:NAD(P)-dependent dehydrogenase, short-chain alcohol dehydrogenase family n=1 Tax=Auraticoccus monumenti TaxID=675864 RepID=A0A1G6TSM1_9ACTN|nr:SDR family oxidoreductase [Auraticoccus monumenti]SDD32098.1 NAD(P)-dependent dehydrogenase, short-chain alcohol dehydrogenase family [Auraticoccus monumenti]
MDRPLHRFTDRTALVSGGGHGIGRACVHRLADEGARVVCADLDLEAAERVAAEVREAGREAHAVHVDVTSSDSVDAAVARAVELLGGLDVLVNTAGGGRIHPDFPETSDEVWHQQLDLNLMSVVRTVRAALPHLLDGGGSVVSTSSVNAVTPIGSEPYSSAKAALDVLTQNLAREHGPAGVRFNLVLPGTIRTRVWDDQAETLERFSRAYPLGRVGQPEDVAAAVAFLSSDDAAWITGVALRVDGGLLVRGAMDRA